MIRNNCFRFFTCNGQADISRRTITSGGFCSSELSEELESIDCGGFQTQRLTENQPASFFEFSPVKRSIPIKKVHFENSEISSTESDQFNCIKNGRELMSFKLENNNDSFHSSPRYSPWKHASYENNESDSGSEKENMNSSSNKLGDKKFLDYDSPSFQTIKEEYEECSSEFKVLEESKAKMTNEKEFKHSEIEIKPSLTSLHTGSQIKTPSAIALTQKTKTNSNYYETLKKKYELYTVETGGSKCLFFNQPESEVKVDSEKKNELVFEHSEVHIKSSPQSSTYVAQGLFPSYQSSLRKGRNETTTLTRRFHSKGVRSPESKTHPLYNSNSNCASGHFPDGHNNQGEPVDLSLVDSSNSDIKQEVEVVVQEIPDTKIIIEDSSTKKGSIENVLVPNTTMEDILPEIKQEAKPPKPLKQSRNVAKRATTDKLIDCILESEQSPRNRIFPKIKTKSSQSSALTEIDTNKMNPERLKVSCNENIFKNGLMPPSHAASRENIKSSPIFALQERKIIDSNKVVQKLDFEDSDYKDSELKENIKTSWNELAFKEKNKDDSVIRMIFQDSDYPISETTDVDCQKLFDYNNERYDALMRSKSKEKGIIQSFTQSMHNMKPNKSCVPLESGKCVYKSMKGPSLAKKYSKVSSSDQFMDKSTVPSKNAFVIRNGSLREEFESVHQNFKNVIGKRKKGQKKSKSRKRQNNRSKNARSLMSRKSNINFLSSTVVSSVLIQEALKNQNKYSKAKRERESAEIYLL
ncbi:unnamed protein product [Moneuplotes crassus]|uniref:Uncharacterized protein n=1 Tax=Euplotes crassus TaxID=5936 RepID=A0AAD1Y411_EUPCR|nr:unnamed protein product [Moneuplotes crassus]